MPTASAAQSASSAASLPSARPWAGIGRPATANEVAAWDIDVRADFTGLPPGSGSVDQGMEVWEGKCASCHGTFGESTEVFTPIVGGTSREDIERGRVANLRRADFPQRTTLMKLAHVSTLWDYIRRAMPWNAPKSLTVEEVYAVTAYILNLGDVVPADFVLSDKNIAEVQKLLPNRDGLALFEPLWSANGKTDVPGDGCMSDCAARAEVSSELPVSARDSHGNLAAQNRVVGPVRGADTTTPLITSLADAQAVRDAARATITGRLQAADSANDASAMQLAADANCTVCHAQDKRSVGPSFRDVAQRYRGQPGAEALLAGRVKNGNGGVWGSVPMPANSQVPEDDIRLIVGWILDGAP
ncbi:MAG: c-type cytochrome [Gammaproteobacteria bacterium]